MSSEVEISAQLRWETQFSFLIFSLRGLRSNGIGHGGAQAELPHWAGYQERVRGPGLTFARRLEPESGPAPCSGSCAELMDLLIMGLYQSIALYTLNICGFYMSTTQQ